VTVLASAIISRVRTQMIDLGLSGPLRWGDTELQQWIADAQRTIIAAAPRASSTVVTIPLVAGTRQTIPTNGYVFLKAYRNMGVSRNTPGNALEVVPRELMDTQYPTWHTATAVTNPPIVIFDPSDPTAFYVSPPSDGTGSMEINYSQGVADFTADTQPLIVSDIYQTPVFDYTMFRACQKDSDYAAGQQIAATYLNAFQGFLKAVMTDDLTTATQTGRT